MHPTIKNARCVLETRLNQGHIRRFHQLLQQHGNLPRTT